MKPPSFLGKLLLVIVVLALYPRLGSATHSIPAEVCWGLCGGGSICGGCAPGIDELGICQALSPHHIIRSGDPRYAKWTRRPFMCCSGSTTNIFFANDSSCPLPSLFST